MSIPSFRFDPDKLIEAVDFLLRSVGPCTRMKLVKLIYLADRFHLVRHGTPILGDRYYRLPWGPVPSRALDLLEAAADLAAGDPEVAPDAVSERLLERINIEVPESKYARYWAKGEGRRPDSLAPSEVEALDAVAGQYGKLSPRELSDLTHRHRAYLDTPASQEIDYRLFFLDEPGVSQDAFRYLEFSQEDRALVERLRP